MLYLLNKKQKNFDEIFIGDRVNVIYRFNGVFFFVTGFCVLNKKASLCILSKKKEFFFFFYISKLHIHIKKSLNSFFFNKKNYKIFYRKFV